MKNYFKDYGETSFITGMRAFSALGVILTHAGGGGLHNFGHIAGALSDFGRTGVYVFFVISGFSVAYSYTSCSNYFEYLNKRIWRIAPLYYFYLVATITIGATSVFWQETFHLVGISTYNFLLHIAFLSFLDYRVANSIIGVEWSIPIEVFWYFIVPLLLLLSNTNKKLLYLIIFSFLVYNISKIPAKLSLFDNAALAIHWSPLPYIFSYSLGIAAFMLRNKVQHTNISGNSAFIFSIIITLVHVLFPGITKKLFLDELTTISIATAIMITYGSRNSSLFKYVFCNSLMQKIGTLSYGIYLCHIPVMTIMNRYNLCSTNATINFFVFALVSTILSFFTYISIERYGNLIGKKTFEALRPAERPFS